MNNNINQNNQIVKMCTVCEQAGQEYYTYKDRHGVRQEFNKCKGCFNIHLKKKTGPAKQLNENQIQQLKLDLLDRRNKMVDLAWKYNVPYHTLLTWIKKGLLKPDPPKTTTSTTRNRSP